MNPSIKKQIEQRTSDYVCFDCGRMFLSEEQKVGSIIVTAHVSKCGLCGNEKSVTHMRAFNYLQKTKIK